MGQPLMLSPRIARIAIAMLLALAHPAHAQVWLWSQTATSNGNIDPSINWQEGMPPSAVDDSARATLAGVAKWRDDGSGLVTLGGTSTAYTATTNQGNQSGGVSSLTPGYRLCFSPNVVNSTPATLAVDSQAAKPLRRAPNTALVGGEMQIGTPYCATFFSSNGGEYILNSYYNVIIPNGAIVTAMLANGAVTYAKIQNETNATILGNNSGGSAAPEELTLGQGLGFSGTTVLVPNNAITSGLIANGAVGTTQLASSAVTTAILNNGAVTYAKIQNESNATILGNDSGGAAAPGELTLASSLAFITSTSVGVANGGIGTTQLASGAVTYAKIQNESNATLLGNDSGGAAAPSEISLGTGLQFSSSTVLATNYFTPNIQVFTSGSSATYTTPTNGGNLPLYIRVRMIAGGGGGGAVVTNNGSNGNDSTWVTGGGTWQTVHGQGGTAGPGAGSLVAGGTGGTGGTNGTGTQVRRIAGGTGDAGAGTGGYGGAGGIGGFGSSAFAGAANTTQNAPANTGNGGSSGTGTPARGGGGGAGEYVEFIITAPASSYTYTVGGGGSGGAAGTQAGGNGAAGRIEVEAFWQ